MSIKISDVSKKNGDHGQVSSINLSVQPGSIYGLIGDDGSGKDVLMFMLATLLTPDDGIISMNRLLVGQDNIAIRRIMGYVPKDFSLHADLTVSENIELMKDMYKVEAPIYSLKLAAFKQLAGVIDRPAQELSGGMAQKLAIYCAIIHDPSIILFNEPTRGIDAVSRNEFWNLVFYLKDKGKTIFVATSNLLEAALCDEVGFIRDGKIIVQRRPDQMVHDYRGALYGISEQLSPKLLEVIRAYPGVKVCNSFGGEFRIALMDTEPGIEGLLRYLNNKGYNNITPIAIEPTIEDSYIQTMQACGSPSLMLEQ